MRYIFNPKAMAMYNKVLEIIPKIPNQRFNRDIGEVILLFDIIEQTKQIRCFEQYLDIKESIRLFYEHWHILDQNALIVIDFINYLEPQLLDFYEFNE